MKQKVSIDHQILEIPFKRGETLLSALQRSRLPVHSSCGGMGTCGTCRIIVKEGSQLLPIPNEVEQEMIVDRGFEANERLSCQISPHSEIVIEIP